MRSFLATFDAPYALMFGGQGSRWQTHLAESLALPWQGEKLRSAYQAARALLDPVGIQLLTAAPGASDRVAELLTVGKVASSDARTSSGIGAARDMGFPKG